MFCVDPSTARKLQISTQARGLVVVEVTSDGPAAGLIEKGELIESVDQRPVRHITDLDEILAKVDANRAVRVRLAPSDTSPIHARTVLIRPKAPSVPH